MDFFQSGPPLRPLGPEPVVRDKPLKVREMTRAVLIPKAAKSSDKLPGNPARTEVPAETYYEAYVDDTKYLVPDTNLVAMKDMINYKMRPKTSIKYKNETRFEDVNYKHLHRRLGSMLDKVEIPSDIEQSSVIGDRQRKSSREIENEEVTVGGDPEMRAIIEKEDDEETVIGELQPKLSSEKDNEEEFTESTINNDEKESQEKTVVTAEEQLTEKLSVMSIQSENETSSNLLPVVKPLKSSELLEPQCSGDEDEDLSEHRVRFLISGHLGKDNKPVYIIQEYEGRSSILKDQSATFMTSKEQNNISVSISGRVFKDNILIEEDGKPKSLNIDPENIIIEPEKSKMFRDVFEETLNIEGVNILLKGYK
ncbi:hypothetical protein J6590_011120 [Homalodisca vitripennis]|nr:hypothetical protein J6590_011120 [Homalodisca vitripennis]